MNREVIIFHQFQSFSLLHIQFFLGVQLDADYLRIFASESKTHANLDAIFLHFTESNADLDNP